MKCLASTRPRLRILRHVRGVYLLVRRDTGEQYVGSASGADGFYGRWCNYTDGHGRNFAMKELNSPATAFDVSILEVVGSEATPEHIIEREGPWKDKLTITSDHLVHTIRKVTQNNRSAPVRRPRRPVWARTASCCRRARFSITRSLRESSAARREAKRTKTKRSMRPARITAV